MSYFEFPHTRSYDGDLGYIIKRLNELTAKYGEFMEYNQIKFADPVEWNINTVYPAWNIVFANNGYYIATKPVPAGIMYDNTDYWQLIIPFDVDTVLDTESLNPIANSAVARRFNQVSSSIGNIVSALQNEGRQREEADTALDIRIAELEEDTEHLSGALTNERITRETADTLLSRDIDSLTARVDNIAQTIVPGGTTGDAELADIRVGVNGFTYANAGDAVRGQLSDLQTAIGVNVIKGKPAVILADYYISNTGASVTSGNFDIYGIIRLLKGMSITVYAKGYLTSVAVICLTNESGTQFTPAVISTDSTAKLYTYNATNDCYIAICSNNTTEPYYKINIDNIYDRIEKIEYDKTDLSYTVTNGYFVSYTGVITQSNNWCYSEPIAVNKGELINLYGKGYLTNVAMISTCDSEGNNITPKIISDDSTIKNYSYLVENDGYIILSYNTYNTPETTAYKLNKSSLTALDVRVSALENKETIYPLDILSAFTNITYCGDSLTYSQVYTSASTQRQAHKTYPNIIGNFAGASVDLLATPGYSAVDWWSNFSSRIASKSNQLAIIYLGTNGGFTDTLDTDAPEDQDPSMWATNNTGSLAKIVNEFKNVGAKIILVKCYSTSGTGTSDLATTNMLIQKVADRFGCGLVNNDYLSDIKYHYYPDRSGSNAVHYNDLGYAAFARMIINNVSFMENNYMKYVIPN